MWLFTVSNFFEYCIQYFLMCNGYLLKYIIQFQLSNIKIKLLLVFSFGY